MKLVSVRAFGRDHVKPGERSWKGRGRRRKRKRKRKRRESAL